MGLPEFIERYQFAAGTQYCPNMIADSPVILVAGVPFV